jgi:uncharacterized protein YicC (UPF0701 family)
VERVAAISAQQAIIEKIEPIRRAKVKENLIKQLEQHIGADKYDANRLEQELIYYIEKFEPNRRVKIKEGLVKLLEQHVGPDKYDNNRLEQELIYYIEKIDISEEKVRLNNHCTYFKTVLKEAEASKGKKLSFILQEMGREINTTGSKANDMEMQKSVILMKDELEKAKEQILNVL